MDAELQTIVASAQRLLTLSRRLAQENSALLERLEEAQSRIELLQRRTAEARTRVEAALERLPTLADLNHPPPAATPPAAMASVDTQPPGPETEPMAVSAPGSTAETPTFLL